MQDQGFPNPNSFFFFLNALFIALLLMNYVDQLLLLTGKSFSKALILASTNPQHDDRLFIELQVQYMKTASSEHAQSMLCT